MYWIQWFALGVLSSVVVSAAVKFAFAIKHAFDTVDLLDRRTARIYRELYSLTRKDEENEES